MANGDLKLKKPNLKTMTLKELRKYVLAHRQDEEAWKEFVSRPRPKAVIVSADTPLEEQELIFKKLFDKRDNQ